MSISRCKSSPPELGGEVCRSVLMVGTALETMGGISSMIRAYRAVGLFDHYPVSYVVTHRDGSGWVKLRTALKGWVSTVTELWRMDKPLVHVHLSFRASFWRKAMVCLIARAFGRPYLLHLHSGGFLDFYENECGPVGKLVVRTVIQRAATVIALSEQWKALLNEAFPDAAVVVLPNAVALPNLSERVPPRAGAIRVVCLGRIGTNKGTQELLEAFAQVSAEYPSARLVCAGDGDTSAYVRHASELGVGERVEFPGWLNRQQCNELLMNAGIFALPSYSEGLPMALLEAMSCGVSVIATPVGGIPEIVENDHNGLLVPPGDIASLVVALRALLGDAQLRERLGNAARATIERSYSIDAHTSRLLDAYRRVGVEFECPA